MTKTRVGVDLDGVIYDFGNAFGSFLQAEYNWPGAMCAPPQRWTFYEDWGLTAAGFKMVCNEAADAGRLWNVYGCTNYAVVDAFKELANCPAVSVHIITDRHFGSHPAVSHEATARWLRDIGLRYDTLTFSPDKTIVATDFMIDDKRENYTELRSAGTEAYLLDKPWNQDDPGQHPSIPGVPASHRIRSVVEFVEIVLDAAVEKERVTP
ncbi:5' nucleotidase [Gordonia Phage Engineer]|nr:5' nucleotidase [Gordonia Phage Engineer]